MKKKLLFVIDSLECAGAEKSLVTLLNLLDYSRLSVDLMLFAHGRLLEELVPKEVNILKPLKYTMFTGMTLKEAAFFSIKNKQFNFLAARLNYSYRIRTEKYNDENVQKARIYWQCVNHVIEDNPVEYDVAISYAQGIPTFYVAEKVKAKKKYTWVNVSYRLDEKEREYQKQYYENFDRIVAVSDSTKEIFLQTYPAFSEKMDVIYDINHPDFISNMAELGVSYNDHFNGIRILTIGRLDHQKGYEIALEACKKLKEQGINFRWYILGKGTLKEDIVKFVKENGLTDYFILLGTTSNPYSYIKNCDIYVQTSRFEGFGLAIAEARMLNKPVVTTRFDSVFNQMIHEKNGLVVDMNGAAVCEGILQLINKPSLRENIINYLKTEKKGKC